MIRMIIKWSYLIVSAMAILGAFVMSYRELNDQFLIGVNNKGHEDLKPYRIAFTKRFGAEFAERHFVEEGRVRCDFAGKPSECGYIRFKDLQLDRYTVIQDLIDTATKPCRWISDEAVSTNEKVGGIAHRILASKCNEMFDHSPARITFERDKIIEIEIFYQTL